MINHIAVTLEIPQCSITPPSNISANGHGNPKFKPQNLDLWNMVSVLISDTYIPEFLS